MKHLWMTVVFAASALGLVAQDKGRTLRPQQATVTPATQEARVALVIGNGGYQVAPLKNPVNDARAVAEALKQSGFAVTRLEDATRAQMREAIRTFGARIAEGGVGLFYFAGHGMQVKGRNYLVPVGADIAMEDEVAGEAVEVDAILAKMETARNRLNILILDACRNNPFGRSFRSTQQGLAQVDAPTGTFVAFATAPGRTAADGSGANGLYTEALLRQFHTPGLKLEEVFKRTRADVLRTSGHQQTPWENSSIVGDFYFVPGVPAETPLVNLPPAIATSDPESVPDSARIRFAGKTWEILEGNWRVEGDALIGTSSKSGGQAHLIMEMGAQMPNYSVECDLECLSGWGWAGLLARSSVVVGGEQRFREATSDIQAYAFNFTIDKTFNLFRGVKGAWSLVNPSWTEWQPSPRLGGRKTRVRWQCRGKTLEIYAGQTLIHRFTDLELPRGSVAFALGEDASYRISNFTLRPLP